MRPAAPTCLAIALLVTTISSSHAEFRHLSSRLFEGGGNESIQFGFWPYIRSTPFAASESGDVFLLAGTGTFISFGGAHVGPGTVAARLDAAGHELWSRVLFNQANAQVSDVAVVTDGVLLAGQYSGAVDFGGGPMTSVEGSFDIFVMKLDDHGDVTWQHSYGDRLQQYASSVAVAPNGDVIVVGNMQGAVDFGGGVVRTNGGEDIFFLRLDGNGGHISSRQFGQNGNQGALGVAMGADGRIGIAGLLRTGAVSFGGDFFTAVGGDDIVVAVLDAAGGHVWSRVFASAVREYATEIAFDAPGNVFLAGSFTRRLDTGGEPLIAPPSATETGFVASYDIAGAHRWSYMLSDSLRSGVWSLAVDESGNCLVTAHKRERLDFANQTIPPSRDLLLAFDTNGQITAGVGFGDPPASPYFSSPVMMAAADDAIFLAGYTDVPMDFGNGVLVPDNVDVFLAKLAIRRPAQVTIDNFSAELEESGVAVRWNVTSGEPLGDYFIKRRIDDSSFTQTIQSGPAADGEGSFVDNAVKWGHLNTYELTVETALGDPVTSAAVRVTAPLLETGLGQNAPNPFNPLTTFPYTLEAPAEVSIAIYDVSGALVGRIDLGMQPAGRHKATWGGHNAEGSFVGSGVYFYRLEGAGDIGARKMVLLK